MQPVGTKQQLQSTLNVTVNVAPIHSKETRYLFAAIARGEENAQDIEFYADLMECAPSKTVTPNNQDTTDGRGSSSEIDTMDIGGSQDKEDNTLSEYIESYKESMYEIIDDLTSRLKEGDHNLLSGVVKFINRLPAIDTYLRLAHACFEKR